MRAFTQARTPDTLDEIWFVEHPPVYTQGQAGKAAHLLTAQGAIPVVHTDRGGQITFHGPGQVIAYLLLDLHRRTLKVRELVNQIEQAVLDTLLHYGIEGERRTGAPGIYLKALSPALCATGEKLRLWHGAKIAALGLKIHKGCSYHGLSLNVDMDLQPFNNINPCGYAGLQTIDMAKLGVHATWTEVAKVLAEHIKRIFEK